MGDSSVWFSHKEYRYDAELKDNQRVFRWSDNSEIWDWNNCTVSSAKGPEDKIRVIIRSTHMVQSEYMKKNIQLKYMLGFDVSNINEPKTENYPEPSEHNVKNKVYGTPRPRWVLELDEHYWIWEWVNNEITIENSDVYKIYLMLRKEKDTLSRSNIFNVSTEDDDRIIPVIYMPAIDSWKNFVREIHCYKVDDNEFEVTILFNNESLREHAILNSVYEGFRSLFYGRTIDVETFRIMLKQEVPENFQFKGIYSGENNIEKDDIHEDKEIEDGRAPTHTIKYYFANTKHPIVFINTANHAMAEHDTNQNLWKWEYVAWEKDLSIVYGEKSRQEIDKSFKPKMKFW
ncbi:MAG: hypothetical protein HY222_03880 [Thaumarchaeota archaeon]|nr:hypothetical protein [Nitrososphaerota archaeon]MBI3641514.1 hypothetical protein [Nitrososphaerota archaeon]